MTDFTATINGVNYNFNCYTTNTRNGFCHHCVSNGEHTRISYYNRTWESFQYETVLRRAIEKYPKALRDELTNQLIYHKAAEEHERCEKELADFKATYDQLSPENKERLAKSNIVMNSEDDMKSVKGLMSFMNLMDSIGK